MRPRLPLNCIEITLHHRDKPKQRRVRASDPTAPYDIASRQLLVYNDTRSVESTITDCVCLNTTHVTRHVRPQDIPGLKVSRPAPNSAPQNGACVQASISTCRKADKTRYMSGPKADAILAHAGVDKKKRRKKPKNEDYIGGSGSSGSGLILKDEDQWGSKRKDDIDLDGDDAPGKFTARVLRISLRCTRTRSLAAVRH